MDTQRKYVSAAGLPLVKESVVLVKQIEENTGCGTGGWAKFSYVISGPLHMKGIWAFWKSNNVGWPDKVAVVIDLLFHLTLWIAALVLEIATNAADNRGPPMLAELNMVALWSLIAAFLGILVAQIFAMCGRGQEVGRLFPSTYGAIVGGAYTSIIMSILWTIQSVGWAAMAAQYADNEDVGDDLKWQRHAVLWGIALKTCAVVTLSKNASFWGPCTTNEAKEIQEQNAVAMAANPELGFSA